MSETCRTSYDEVPYESHPFAQTHPDRLRTVATLLGMRPAPASRCRVLELGCAGGGNLIPMALGLPDSTFLGVDLSRRQVAEGQRLVDILGLKNVELRQLDIQAVNADFGRFDYIICHGVYSWVPPAVQDKILEICAQNLAPNGVAYVSYNTYPGWHLRGMIRAMMCYHARHFTTPQIRVRQARNLLDFLAKSVGAEGGPYSSLLKSELEVIRNAGDPYLFHDHLEDVNDPVYFYQFAERAEAKGLRYLGEVDLRVMVPGNYPPEVANVLQMLSPDLIHLEQYMDFLRNRMFRQTLLCHPTVVPNYALRPEQLTAFQISSAAKPVSANPDIHSTAVEQFRDPGGTTLSCIEPIAKAAMVCLSEVWPQAIPFGTLRATARSRVEPQAKSDAGLIARDTQVLGQCLLACFTSGSPSLAELYLEPPRFSAKVSERPLASPLARVQGSADSRVANLRHELVVLEEFDRQVLLRLDGRHSHSDLLDELEQLVGEGILAVQQDGEAITAAETIQRHLEAALQQRLQHLANKALLVS